MFYKDYHSKTACIEQIIPTDPFLKEEMGKMDNIYKKLMIQFFTEIQTKLAMWALKVANSEGHILYVSWLIHWCKVAVEELQATLTETKNTISAITRERLRNRNGS